MKVRDLEKLLSVLKQEEEIYFMTAAYQDGHVVDIISSRLVLRIENGLPTLTPVGPKCETRPHHCG